MTRYVAQLQQFVHSAHKHLQSANVHAEISLHGYTIRKQATININRASDSQASQATRPAGLQDTH